MAFQLSPGVNVSEIDLTTVVPAVATSDGAIGGVFRWGPIGERLLIDSETALVSKYGKPTNFNAETWFSTANFLSYGSSIYVSRAANTTGSTPYLFGNSTFSSNVVLLANSSVSNNILTCNTSGLVVGMYITQSANLSLIPAGEQYYITAANATAIVLSKNLFNSALTSTAAAANTEIYLGRAETSYTAVGLLDSTAFVANLAGQIVKNENHYTTKDGTFDTDVGYLAKFPGAIGNSLRVSVCDNSDSYSTNLSMAYAPFYVGSSNTVFKVAGSAAAGSVVVGDKLLAGNSSIGFQYMEVASKSAAITGNTTSNELWGNTAGINATSGFVLTSVTLASNPYLDGEIVTYAPTAGNTALSNFTSLGILGTNNYFVVGSTTDGFYLSNTYGGTALIPTPALNSSFTLKGNTYNVSLSFVDPYRLREDYTTQSVQRNWEFFDIIGTAPGQSSYQITNGNTAAADELHVVVVDDGGQFTGTPGTVLEVFKGLSRATDAKNIDGSDNYYKNVINQSSEYIWWANDRTTAVSNTALNLATSTSTASLNTTFKLGADGKNESTVSLGVVGQAYDLFASAEDIDISLVLQGKPLGGTTTINGQSVSNFQLANYIIDNICETRKDCVGFITPDKTMVTNNVGNEALSLKNWRGALRSTSYAVLDSGYKYQYDRYNDVYRWIPLNGDIAGLCARTDQTNDAWWSPAGYNRGSIKNIIKLAYNPRKSERDVLFSNGINPVISQPGQGIVLFGDKTLQTKPSAFDHINVRRLFIVLEKAISTASKYSLFEFNDDFTRAQFKNLVTPYLRQIQGRRGITDFLVICDETNNTPQVIDNNQFVGDIYIKPARAINFIQLNFVAVPTGVQFSEVVGQF